MVEKEILALLRILDIFYTLLVLRDIKVLMRYSTLAWLLQLSGLNEDMGDGLLYCRLGRWRLVVVTKGKRKSSVISRRVLHRERR